MPDCPHLTDALAAAMAGLAPARPDLASDPPDGDRPAARRVIPGLRWRATTTWPTASWEAAEAQETWNPPPRRRIGGR